MRLRADISVEIDAVDFADAARHERALRAILIQVRQTYANAEMELRERRRSARAMGGVESDSRPGSQVRSPPLHAE